MSLKKTVGENINPIGVKAGFNTLPPVTEDSNVEYVKKMRGKVNNEKTL